MLIEKKNRIGACREACHTSKQHTPRLLAAAAMAGRTPAAEAVSVSRPFGGIAKAMP